jgi:hypothetical protein
MNIFQFDVGAGENRLGEAPLLFEQGEKEMLDVNLLVPAACGHRLCRAESLLEFFRKAVKIHNVLSS